MLLLCIVDCAVGLLIKREKTISLDFDKSILD